MASVQLFGVPAKPVHGLARGALVLAAFLTGFVAHTECIHATTGQLLADFSFHSRDLLADPLQPYVYAMRADSNAISVIDTRTLSITSTIPLSGTGYGMALSPDGNSLYATEYSSNAVAVIDTHTLTVARTISLNYGPWAIAAGLNNRLYVLGYNSSNMPLAYQVDASTGILGPVLPSINNPGDFQISPDLHTLYYGDIDRSPAALKSFDVSTATPTLLRQSAFNAIGENGQAVVLSHNGSILTSVCGYPYGMSNYGVVLRNSGDFSTLVPLVTGAYPENLSFSPDDLRAYVAHGAGSSNGVDIFDTSTGTLLNQFPVANFVTNMLVAPNSRQLFVTFDTGPYGNTHTYVYDTGVVPEPASITLLAIGATTLLGRRRR